MAFHIWLAHVPVWIVLLLFAAVPAAIFCVIHYYFRRIVSGDKLIRHHDVAGFLVGIAGVIYAVVLGFIVVTVWVNFDSAQRTADLEASDVAELVGFAGVLPEPAKSELRRSMADYAFEVRDREWPMLVSDRQDMNARDFYGEALPVITSLPGVTPHSFAEALKGLAVQQSALSVLHDLSVHRRERLITAGSGLPFGLYVALVLGALIVLAFVFLFGVDNCVLQLTMTGLIAALIGLLLGVIVCLDRPYSGGIRVSPDAWTLVIDNYQLEEYRTPRSR